jgi:hypothetical protein
LISLALTGCSQDREERRESVKNCFKELWNPPASVDDGKPLMEGAVNYQYTKQNRLADQ